MQHYVYTCDGWCYTWNIIIKHEMENNINFFYTTYDMKHQTSKMQHLMWCKHGIWNLYMKYAKLKVKYTTIDIQYDYNVNIQHDTFTCDKSC